MSHETLVEYGIHDTFDSLSPRYDRPLSGKVMESIAQDMLHLPYEVVEMPTVTLLRTVLKSSEVPGAGRI